MPPPGSSDNHAGIGFSAGTNVFPSAVLLPLPIIFNPSAYFPYRGAMDNFSYYTRSLSEENISDVADDDGDREGLPAGVYDVLITDFNGCDTTIQVVVGQPDSLFATAINNEISCFGANDGSLDVTVFGGTSPYTFLWSNGCLLYTSPSPRDQRGSRMPSSA